MATVFDFVKKNKTLVTTVFAIAIILGYLGSLYSKINSLSGQITQKDAQITKCEGEKALCEASLDRQNFEIKQREIKVTPKETAELTRIKKVYVKDRSCEAELLAYKALFGSKK